MPDLGLKIHDEKLTHEVKSLTKEDSFEEDRIIAYVPGASFSILFFLFFFKKKQKFNPKAHSKCSDYNCADLGRQMSLGHISFREIVAVN